MLSKKIRSLVSQSKPEWISKNSVGLKVDQQAKCMT